MRCSLDTRAQKNFDTIETDLKDKKLPQVILDRHTDVVRAYKQEMQTLTRAFNSKRFDRSKVARRKPAGQREDNVGSSMRYRQDLSLAENAAFALLFFLPWLGIPLLVIRRKRLTNRYGSYHEVLLWALSFGLWLVLCATTSGPIMTLVAASIGSMSIAVFLLGIEEARMDSI